MLSSCVKNHWNRCIKMELKSVLNVVFDRNVNIMFSVSFYLRYTQPPADLVEWYDGFLDDDEVCHPW